MEIGHGHINVTLSDQEAIAGLRRVDKEFDRTMDRIDRRKAEAEVGADLQNLRADLKKAEALVKEWERKVADARTRGQKRYRTAQLQAAQAEAANIRRTLQLEADKLKELKAQNRERDAAAAKEKALEQAARRQLREQEKLLKAKNRSLEAAHKETLEAAKLQRQYSKLQQELQRIEHRRGQFLRRFDRPAQIRLRIDQRSVQAQIEETRRRLVELGDTPIEIPRDVDRGRLAKWLGDLTTMTVRIGPFTTTIAQLTRSMLLLGPIIIGVVGAIGSLAAAMGAGLAGAAGVAAAGLVGLGMAAGGIGLIVKPLIADFKEAKKASDAYSRAVLKYGKNSEQAKAAQDKLNQTLKGVDPAARTAFRSIGNLGSRWQRLTRDARPDFFNVLGDGVRTINTLMPAFARNSVQAFRAVSTGLREWMAGLRSAEGQRIIDNIFKRFNQAIPSIMRGFGALGTAAGRIFESFSRHFQSLGRGFQTWAQGIADATGRTGRLNSTVDTMVNAMRSTGRFLGALTRVFVQFFRAGVGPGIGALDRMTNRLNQLAASMSTVEGQRGLRNFFQDSIETAVKFLAAMRPVAELFFEFTTIMRPFTDTALDVVRVFGNIVQAVADFGPSRAIVQAFVAAWTAWSIAKILGIAGAISRVGAALKALAVGQGAMAALGALFAGGAASRAGRGGGAIASSIERITAAAAGGSVAAKILQGLGRSFLRVAGPAGIAASAALIFGGNAKTAATQANELTNQSRSLSEQITASSRSLAGSYTNIANNSMTLADANKGVSEALKEVNRLQAAGKTGTQAYRDAITNLNLALGQRQSAEQQIAGSQKNLERAQGNIWKATQASSQAHSAYGKAIGDVENHVDKLDSGYKSLIERYGSLENAPLDAVESLKALAGHEDDLARTLDAARGAHDRLNAAQRQHKQVLDLAALGTVNYNRAVQGLLPIAASAAAAVGRLQRTLGTRRVAQISLKFPDPREAERVMRAIDRAIASGVGKRRAFNLVINSKNAEQAVARVKAAMAGLSNKEIRIIEKGGKEAIGVIEDIIGRKLTPKEQRIAEQGGARALAMIARIEAQRIRDKEASIKIRDGQARSAIGGIIGMLAGIPRSVTTTHIVQRRQRGPGPNTRAEGGPVSPEEKAAARAAQSGLKSVTGGGIFRRPTFLVGEEDRSEIVIATNPRYRRRNLGFLGMAARALGANATLPDGTVLAQSGFANSEYYAPARLPSAPPAPRRAGKQPRSPKKRRARTRRTYKAQNRWSSYIANLKTQQDDWEREAALRTAKVLEPDDFIVEVGRTRTVRDPETGEVFGNEPIYGVDEAAVADFQGQLQAVKDAYDRLVAITKAIVEAVPKAIEANNAEIAIRRENIRQLKRAIKGDRPRTRSKNKRVASRAENRIRKNEARLQRETDALDALREDNRNLPGDQKEAGFDVREYSIESRDIALQMGDVRPRAEEEARQSSAAQPDVRPTPTGDTGGTGGGGGGGTTTEGPSRLEQVGTLSNERANILRQFGSNAIPRPRFGGPGFGGPTPAVSSGAFTGFGTNVASRQSAFGASGAFGPRVAGGTSGSTTVPASGGDKIINVNNYFSEPPPEPHQWSQGVSWELQAAV